MNAFDDLLIDEKSHAYLDLLGQDKWSAFAPVFGSLTVVGAPNYAGRLRVAGKSVAFQVRFSAATSIASVAGTDYLNLPMPAKGLSGFGVMTNATTKIGVGWCYLDASASRLYLPAQVASASVFNLYGQYEI